MQAGCSYTVSSTVLRPGCGRKESKSLALMLMLTMRPSTGRPTMRSEAPASDIGVLAPISTIVTAYSCSRAAERMPRSVARLPNSVTS